MAEEPSLPRLPALAGDQQGEPPSNKNRKRVRQSLFDGLNNSSDPAIFSSDDDPGLDNYVEGRKKKRYIGSWFRQQPASSDSTFGEGQSVSHGRAQRMERKMVRQVDSGVYLGSDDTDDLSSELSEMLARSKLPQWFRRPQTTMLPKADTAKISDAEALARKKIQDCLDRGNETVDLWSMGLAALSNETIRPLATLTCVPMVAKDVAFEQKAPELQIYMALNQLRLLPGALFELQNLTVLSLRGNKITELPPAIAKLSNLRQLNLSQNRLRGLPAELLDLFSRNLQELIVHPNPFYQPGTLIDCHKPSGADDGRTKEGLVARYCGRSRLQLTDSFGNVVSGFRFPACDQPGKLEVSSARDSEEEKGDRPSRVPTLTEASLQKCYQTKELDRLPQYLPDGFSRLGELLERVAQQKVTGGLVCTGCRKLVMTPRLQWLEWHDVSVGKRGIDGKIKWRPLSLAEDQRVVPFVSRGCSWKCGPHNHKTV